MSADYDWHCVKINKEIKTKDGKIIPVGESNKINYQHRGWSIHFNFKELSQFLDENDMQEWVDDFIQRLSKGDSSQLDGDYSYIVILDDVEDGFDIIYNGTKARIENDEMGGEIDAGRPEPIRRFIRKHRNQFSQYRNSIDCAELYPDIDIIIIYMADVWH